MMIKQTATLLHTLHDRTIKRNMCQNNVQMLYKKKKKQKNNI